MPHSLILGMTESGKSFWAKMLCEGIAKKGGRVVVLDSLNPKEWKGAEIVTANPSHFLNLAQSQKSLFLFIDESGQNVGRYNPQMEWLATQSRHWGHQSWFLTQGGTQLSPIIRDQCSYCDLFACSLRASELAADAWREPALKNLGKFRPGEFYRLSRFSPTVKGQIDFAKRTVKFSPLGKARQHAA